MPLMKLNASLPTAGQLSSADRSSSHVSAVGNAGSPSLGDMVKNSAIEEHPAHMVDTHRDISSGRRVLLAGAQALSDLADGLGESYQKAVDLLAQVKGRVVVTGIGKSGHIGRKIAATLASTGTPAQFVHAGEASHGDLGMIGQSDALLALSNSGETRELSDIIHYAARYSIPLIGITANPGSSLASAAQVTLCLPPHREACSLGLAPTTSTTMMLTLGDALAITLLERKGFTSEDFRLFHPGGKLGAALIKVETVMHRGSEMPLSDAGLPLSKGLLIMTEKRFGCLGVLEGSALIGIITDGDLRRHMAADLLDKTAAEIMTADPTTIAPQTLVAEALGLMNTRGITSVFVVADRKPLGIIHMHDCLHVGAQ